MKSASLTLPFFLFAFTAYLPLAFTQVEEVKDTNGNPIFPYDRLYIMPAIFGAAGGGVRLGKTGNSTCPVTVLQDYSEVVNGMIVQFVVPEILPTTILTGEEMDIIFEEKPKCAIHYSWVVVSGDFPSEYVGIGGVEDQQGKRIIDGKFNIQKHGFGYKLVFCPTITAPPNFCFNIGRYNDENGRRLILTKDDPFEVVFVGANQYATRSYVL